MPGPRVLIVNAYSTLNLGDAVILDGLVRTLRDAGAEHITVAAPADVGETERRTVLGADEVVPMAVDVFRAPSVVRLTYPMIAIWTAVAMALAAVRAVLRPHSSAALRAYVDADLVVSSGGAYIGGPRPGINILTGFQILVARIVRRPCIVAPVTVKPMTWLVAKILSAMLRGATVFARDSPTVARLHAIGIEARLSSDLAFRSPAANESRSPSGGTGMVIAWAPRQFAWDSDVYGTRETIQAAAIEAVTALAREHDARIVLVAQSTADGIEDDIPAVRRALSQLPPDVRVKTDLAEPATIEEAMQTYSSAHVLYAFRLHAAIMALLAGTPALVVPYEAKVRGVFDVIGLGDWVVSSEDALNGTMIAARLRELTRRESVERIRTARAAARAMEQPFLSELRAQMIARDGERQPHF